MIALAFGVLCVGWIGLAACMVVRTRHIALAWSLLICGTVTWCGLVLVLCAILWRLVR